MSRRADILSSVLRAHNGGDVEGVLRWFHPDVELVPLRSLLDGGSYVGHEGYRRLRQDLTDDWGAVRLEVDELREIGDRVLLLGRFCGHGQASGMDVEAPAAWILDFQGDLIVRLRAYASQDEALAQLGAAAR